MNIENLSSGQAPAPYEIWDAMVNSEQPWFQMVSNTQSKHVDIYLYGIIGGWNANLQQFLSELRGAGKVDTITIYLNTIGGVFYHGLPIFNTLKQHPAHVTIKVMGYALSMGSVIMLAGDRIEAAENALIMIHRAQGGVRGSVEDMRKMAETLEKHESAIIPEYMRRMDKSEQEVQALLAAETWYTAMEAKEAGLIDAITEKVDSQQTQAAYNQASPNPEASLSFIHQLYHNVPAHITNTFQAPNEDDTMTPQDMQAIAQAVKTAVAEANVDLIKHLKRQALQEELQANHACLLSENKALEEEIEDYKVPDPRPILSPLPENLGPEEIIPHHKTFL